MRERVWVWCVPVGETEYGVGEAERIVGEIHKYDIEDDEANLGYKEEQQEQVQPVVRIDSINLIGCLIR